LIFIVVEKGYQIDAIAAILFVTLAGFAKAAVRSLGIGAPPLAAQARSCILTTRRRV